MGYVAAFYRHLEIIGRYNKDKIPAQMVHNTGIGYTFSGEKISLGFDLNNIFNAQVFDNFAIQKSGRAAFLKVSYVIM